LGISTPESIGAFFSKWLSIVLMTTESSMQATTLAAPPQRRQMVAISTSHRDQYEKLMDLYLDSNRPENEEHLNRLMEEYSKGD